MAGNFPLDLSSLRDELECSLCFEQFVDPRVLECQHTFCFECLKQLKKGTRINCPLCREDTHVTRMDHLRKNITMNNFLSITSSLTTAVKSKVVKKECGPCGELDILTNYCKTCNMYTCYKCSKAHLRMVQFVDHNIISKEEAELECKILVKNTKKSLCDLSEKLDMKGNLYDELEQIASKKEDIKAEIEVNFSDIICVVEQRMNSLLKKVEDLYSEHVRTLTAQLADINERQRYINTVNSQLENTKEFEYGNELSDKIAEATQIINEYDSFHFLQPEKIVHLRKLSDDIVFIPGMLKSEAEDFNFGDVLKKDLEEKGAKHKVFQKQRNIKPTNNDEHKSDQVTYKKLEDFKIVKRSKFIKYMRETLKVGMQVQYIGESTLGDPLGQLFQQSTIPVVGDVGKIVELAERDGDWPVRVLWDRDGDQNPKEVCYIDLQILGFE